MGHRVRSFIPPNLLIQYLVISRLHPSPLHVLSFALWMLSCWTCDKSRRLDLGSSLVMEFGSMLDLARFDDCFAPLNLA